MRRAIGALILLVLLCAPVRADETWDVARMARELGVAELRAGLMLHGIEINGGQPLIVAWPSLDYGKFQNLNAEVIFRLPDSEMLRWLGSPRLALGGTLNVVGKDSYAYLAANWHVPVLDTGVFVEPSIGSAIHDGYLHNAPAGRRVLGCRILLYYGVNVGYQVTDSFSVMGTIDHASHNWACGSDNDGINRLGLRFGWTLD